MSDVIRLLPDSVANQIAAGEVIQRPASVIKELVENAVDAGAKHIDVAVTEAGKSCIQVVDDGKGMSVTDARLAFERHATSKIREATDLFALRTMGFRGEALASIAAVAQVELCTCLQGESIGTAVTIEGSRFISQEPVACPVGSNFKVNNLFYNIPARRKFLKSNQTELSNIMTELERIILVNPDIAFRFFQNETEVLSLPVAPLRERIVSLFGKKINQELMSVDVETPLIKIHGYIGKPESARKKGARQFFFTNGRYMRHPYFHKAVMDNYENLIPTGEQISYFLYFEIEPARIDVNIHPTKTEIKFENEFSIWQILSAAVRESLGKFNAVPSIDFDTVDMPDIPVYKPEYPSESVPSPSFEPKPSYNPFDSSSSGASYNGYGSSKPAWEPFFDGLSKKDSFRWKDTPYEPDEWTEDMAMPEEQSVPDGEMPAILPVATTLVQNYQYKNAYILTSVKSGLMLIHQHRAHVCILYHEFMEKVSAHMNASQRLLFPELIHFAPDEIPLLEGMMDELQNLGYDLGDLGNGTYAINGVPAGVEHLNAVSLLADIVHNTREKAVTAKDEIREIVILSMAKAAAIRPDQRLSNDEMDHLLERLLALPTPNYTPDGKTVISVISDDEIRKLFR